MSASALPGHRPRVLQCLTHLALGGAEHVAFSLMEGLRQDFDFGVFAVRPGDAGEFGRSMLRKLEDWHIPLVDSGSALPLKLGGLPWAGVRLAKAARSFRPDVIHLHTEIPEAAAALMPRGRLGDGKPALLRTIHNSVYWASWPRIGRWCDHRLRLARVVAVSQAAREAFLGLRGEPGTPVGVIPNGISLPKGLPVFSRPPTNRARLLFAGRLETQKGADLLPAILAAVRPPAGRPAELVIHGDGAWSERLRSLEAAPPAGWTVRVLAPVPDLLRQLPGFDAVLVPSRFEGVGLIALEAMLQGVTLVATDAPGLREQLPPGHPWRARAGDAADFARVLQDVLDRPEALPEAARTAQEHVRGRFSAETMLTAYAALYASLLRG
jgi:glycosyltransferase involved in cell wall biosynthesis